MEKTLKLGRKVSFQRRFHWRRRQTTAAATATATATATEEDKKAIG